MTSSKVTTAILTLILCALAAACGTAGDGGKATSPADAQVAVAPPADTGLEPMPAPPALPFPKAPGPGTPPAADAPSGGPCATDGDCVPATCCHPKTCVARAQAPACAGTMCTLDCRVGTMDCGGGACVCKDGTCAAQLKKPGFVQAIEEAAGKPQ
jgi:hypothetical protein